MNTWRKTGLMFCGTFPNPSLEGRGIMEVVVPSHCSMMSLKVGVLLIRDVLHHHVVDGDDPTVIELPVEHHLLLLHLRLRLHHLQCGVVMVAVLHRV